jgi:hypothetical protein
MVLLSHDVVHLRYITIFFISATVRSEKVEVCVFCELADLHCAAAVELVAYGIFLSHNRLLAVYYFISPSFPLPCGAERCASLMS